MNRPPASWRRALRCRAAFAVALLAAASGRTAQAQGLPASYVSVSDRRPYQGLAATVPLTPPVSDSGTTQLDLPFALTLFGEQWRRIYINANGFVSVATANNGYNFAAPVMPSVDPPNGFIAVLWDDWCSGISCPGVPNPGSEVFTEIDATEGRVSVEWRRVKHFRDDVVSSDVTFRWSMFEGPTGRMTLTYGSITPGRDAIDFPTELRPRIGFESVDGTMGAWLAPCNGPQPCSTSEAAQLVDRRIIVAADLGPDLGVDDLDTPSQARPGLPMAVRLRLLNLHASAVGPVRYSAYIVPAADTSTVGRTAVFTGAPTTLGAASGRIETFDLPVPNGLAEGDYRVVVVVDPTDGVAESDERNNRAVGRPVTIAGRGPDFVAENVRPLSARISAGQPLEVAYRFGNRGNQAAAVRGQVFLSTNPLITNADRRVGSPIVASVAAGQTITGTATQLLDDLRTGRYFVGLVADIDLAVDELDESNNVARAEDAIVVVSSELVVLTDSLPPAAVGRPYSALLEAAGGDGGYRVTVTGLPPGLVLDGARISGTPTEAGAFELNVEVESDGRRASARLALPVTAEALPLTLVEGPVAEGFVGQDYEVEMLAIGGQGPYRWALTDGRLPPGLSLAPDGVIAGVLRGAGAFPIEVMVTDAAGSALSRQVTLTVRPSVNLTITSPAALPAATINVAYREPLLATGGRAPLLWSAETVLPPGLSVASTGEIIGLPEAVGQYGFRVEVRDAVGNRDLNFLRLEVRAETEPVIEPERLPEAEISRLYVAGLRATGGRRPLTWAIEGDLPPGMVAGAPDPNDPEQADAEFVIRGASEEAGAWGFTVRVIDDRGRRAERPYAIWVRVLPPAEESDGCRCVEAACKTDRLSGWGWILLLGSGCLLRRSRRSGIGT